jgi:hypothetical protein
MHSMNTTSPSYLGCALLNPGTAHMASLVCGWLRAFADGTEEESDRLAGGGRTSMPGEPKGQQPVSRQHLHEAMQKQCWAGALRTGTAAACHGQQGEACRVNWDSIHTINRSICRCHAHDYGNPHNVTYRHQLHILILALPLASTPCRHCSLCRQRSPAPCRRPIHAQHRIPQRLCRQSVWSYSRIRGGDARWNWQQRRAAG